MRKYDLDIALPSRKTIKTLLLTKNLMRDSSQEINVFINNNVADFPTAKLWTSTMNHHIINKSRL